MIDVVSAKCRCGHFMHQHTVMDGCFRVIPDSFMGKDWWTSCSCKAFRLDNLTYIEQLAEERRLV